MVLHRRGGVALTIALAIALPGMLAGAVRADGDEPSTAPEVCESSSRCHDDHPDETIPCPSCERRKIAASDATCTACASRTQSCRHCGLPRANARAGKPSDRSARSDRWARIPARVEAIESSTYLSFQPVRTAVLRVDRDVRTVTAYGAEGKIAVASVAGGVITLAAPARVAELTLHDVAADEVELTVPRDAVAEPTPPAKDHLEALGEFKPTFYWVLLEDRFDGEPDTELPGHDGEPIGRFPAEFVRKAKIEGTAKLRDGRVVNVWGKGTWKVVPAPNGLGTKGYHLIPFRSIAVDRTVVPIGTPLFIPEAVGMRLPDGTVHDGRFWTHDVGGGIKGKRIDIFTGLGRRQDVFSAAGIQNMRALTIYRVNEPAGR